jgi:hypothetical protein
VLRYADSREVMEWHYLPESGTLSDLRVSINGGELFRPAAGGGFRLAVAGREVEPDDPAVTRRLLGLEIGRTGAVARWEWRVGEVSFPVRLALAACRKSLQVELSAETDLVTEVRLGHYEGGPAAQLVRVPYLDMHGFRHASENPAIVATDTFFLSGLQDWYHSDGSELFGEAGQLAPDRAIYNGGVAYYPRTGGHRNPPRERFVYTVSSRFAEVLPAIPNPPSPWREVTGRSFWITRTWYMTPDEYEATRTGREPSYFEQESAFFRTLHGYGVRDLLVRRHTDIWRQYLPMDGDPYTFITAIDPRCGGDAGFAEHVRRLRQELGYRVGLYTNYTIVSPLTYGLWSENLVCLDSNDEWQTGSLSTAMAKVSQVLPLQRDLARTLKRTFGVSCSYQDQITCRPFWGCTDYDRRVVGAAQHSAAFRVHAKVLAEERRLYDGPVLSEGACHWYFAGLCDSNYAQTDGMATPGLLDFQLLRLHPLNDDCGEEIHQEKPDRLAAYCLAYGLTGHYAFSDAPAKNLAPEALARFLKAYFLLRPLQPCYAGVPVRQIRYADAQGNLLPTEEAIRRDVVRLGRTRVTYANGLAATVNLGQEPWLLGTGAEAITLPRNGFLVELPGKVVARRTLVDGHPAEFVDTPECIFLDGNGQHTDFGPVAAKYAYVLRREGGRLSLVPAPFREAESVTLRPGALGLPEAVVVDVVGPGAVELPGRGSSRP